MPIAARWRVPNRLEKPSLRESGRKQDAAAIRSFETMTAPSWSGVPGANSVTSRSYETAESRRTPFSMYVFNPSCRSSTMRAPTRRVEREVVARTISEIISSAW